MVSPSHSDADLAAARTRATAPFRSRLNRLPVVRALAATLGSLAPLFVNIGQRRVRDEDEVLLTFDDGPHPRATPAVLEVLATQHARAVFFLNGQHIEEHPSLARAIVEAGHIVANHGYRHTRWTAMTSEDIRTSLENTEALLDQLDSTRPRLVRAPYGRFPRRAHSIVRSLGLHPVAWSCMPYDFVEDRTVSEMCAFLHRHLSGGTIVVLHENDRTQSRIKQLTTSLFDILHTKHLRAADPRGNWQ